MEGNKDETPIVLDAERSKAFWSLIWSESKVYNGQADWLNDIEENLGTIRKQETLTVTEAMVEKEIKKIPNWKAPGPDGVHDYWFKSIKAVRSVFAPLLNETLQSGNVPECLPSGKTVLIVKDKDKVNKVTNFRPFTCLPMMWKLLTGVISEEMYKYLDEEKLLPNEQRGCRRQKRGTKDQLLIDKIVIRNCRRRLTNLAMRWINYKKAYDMIPHSWILKCLKMFGIVSNITALMEKAMEK